MGKYKVHSVPLSSPQICFLRGSLLCLPIASPSTLKRTSEKDGIGSARCPHPNSAQTPPFGCSHPAVPIPAVPGCPHLGVPIPRVPISTVPKCPHPTCSNPGVPSCPHLRCLHWNVVSPSHTSLYTYLHLMCPQISLSQVSPFRCPHPAISIQVSPSQSS